MKKGIFWRYFISISRYSKSYIWGRLKKFKIGSGQSNILRLLSHEGDGISQEEISEQLDLDNTTVARTVQKLEKNRYVEKRKDKNDKRVKRIYLTKKAKKLKQSIEDARNDLMDILFNGISDDEFQAYINVLEKMYENLKRESVEEENTHG
ncbi:MAG: MarR family transcriptional regulator [Caldisericaceae bacterium]|nr:MarR family transcriptional regulator [Caldisericaceae bacterium]